MSLQEALSLIKFPKEEKGHNCRIVIIDTGINPDLPVEDALNLTTEGIEDRENHGSIIHGLIHSILPEAKIYFIKVPDPLPDYKLITALNEALKWEPHAINLSFSLDMPSDGSDPASLYADHVSKKASVVIAAGNSGPRYMTVGSPAAGKEVIAVGGYLSKGYIWKKTSRGPTLDGRWKPNILAPTGINFMGERQYGTSISAPFATVLAALLMRECKSPFITRRIMELTAFPVSLKYAKKRGKKKTAKQFRRLIEAIQIISDPRNITGAGLIQVEDAILYLRYFLSLFSHS